MKKFRPYKAGYIVLYVLCVLCIGDAVWTMVAPSLGRGSEYMQSFSMFSYLIAILAFFYVKMYIGTRVEVDDKTFHFVNTAYIKPAPGAKRAMFIYRQGDTDIKLVDKRFPLAELEKYGYIEDLGYTVLDKSNTGEKNKLFPLHEIAFVMKDGKRYHMNAAYYKPAEIKEMVEKIRAISGVEPTGKLAEVLK